MPLVPSRGNMYEWTTHCHSHLRGRCLHDCEYCYVKSFRNYERDWTGPIRLIEEELKVRYDRPWTGRDGVEHPDGKGKTIFIEHCDDLFARDVPVEYVNKIIQHCEAYPDNTYLFQTKNPGWMKEWYTELPGPVIYGTTIETNREIAGSKAPTPEQRYNDMMFFSRARQHGGEKLMLTIEPIMKFDLNVLSKWIIDIRPDFINLGADSKHHNLPEPTVTEILELVKVLNDNGITINKKENLGRLVK